MYKVPQKYFFRLHHVRPRFKDNVENVLFYVAQEIAGLGRMPKEEFNLKLNDAIRRFPGNTTLTKKTIDNWRTEISSLFGFVLYDGDDRGPSKLAVDLSHNLDLAEFFKKFLFRFQYPGAHITSKSIREQILVGVHFKPAQYILKVMKHASELEGKSVYLTKEEVCHCIFNDLRCTRDDEGAAKTWERIKKNRSVYECYDKTGDVVRYAGDIVDYMVYANLLKTYDGNKFYLQKLEEKAIKVFINSSEWFSNYDDLISSRGSQFTDKSVMYLRLGLEYEKWFKYVSADFINIDFSTDLSLFIAADENEAQLFSKQIEENQKLLVSAGVKVSTKDIGDLGENMIYGHECERIKKAGRVDLVHLIKPIPNVYAVGYDINSVEDNELKRCIEVKSTISTKPLLVNSVHLTANEWNAARSFGDRYYVYRLQIAKNKNELFVIQNPIKLLKQKKIVVTNDGDGVKLSFNPNVAGNYEVLLQWTA